MTERVTVEVNGERITVDVPDGTPDEQIISFIKSQTSAPQEGPVEAEGAGLGAVAPQAATIGKELAKEVPGAVSAGVDLAKQGAKAVGARPLIQTAADVAGVATHGVPWGTLAKNALTADPSTIGQAMGKAKDILKAAPGAIGSGASKVGGALVRGALAPESAFLMPYQMAAEEQAKIRANPNAPEYAKNPYAMSYRSQGTANPITQGQAGAMNAREAVANMPTGYQVSPQEARNLLASGDERMINLYGGRAKLQAIANPNALNSGYAQELRRLGR